MAVTKSKKREKKSVIAGLVHVKATFNNTIITISDLHGNVISFSSGGMQGFKGSKKATPYAAQLAAAEATAKAKAMGLKRAGVLVKGPGSGRESAVRAVQSADIEVTFIRDITPVPHNGCRPPKRRRV